LQKDASSSFSHVVKRLPDGGETGIVVGRDLNIIEADYRDILGHAKIRISQRPNRANRCDIVEGNNRLSQGR
jgi:hypothetical protein